MIFELSVFVFNVQQRQGFILSGKKCLHRCIFFNFSLRYRKYIRWLRRRNGQAEFSCENVAFVVQYINMEGLYCGVKCNCSSNSTHKVLKIPINDSLNFLNSNIIFIKEKNFDIFLVFMHFF